MEITNNAKIVFLYKVGWVNTRWSRVGTVGLWDFSLPSKQFVFAPFTPTHSEKGVPYKLLSTFYDTIGTIGKGKIISRTVSIV